MRRCPFCVTVLDNRGPGGIHPPHWVCPTCGLEESYGLEKLPDPEQLRQKGESLIDLAEQLESGGILARQLRERYGHDRP